MLIAFAGRKGHGKDTAAQVLLNQKKFRLIKFAAPLKNMTRAFFKSAGFQNNDTEQFVEGSEKETPLNLLRGKTSRQFQQLLGTEFARDLISETLWTDIFLQTILVNPYMDYVCTDMRYPNEVQTVSELKGYTIKIINPRIPTDGDTHSSEAFIDGLPTDYVVLNDGSVEQLHNKILDVYEQIIH